ncbi:MAG: T9SS type A sorting domain-containing protein [Dysgonamonadaceae bacterium]|jgi:hypothetical protein|nr:T9SS type A sorting domain-containing protein [Dysgonamonadaceae bacterium]
MEKRVINIVMLLVLSSFGWINAVPPVAFYNKGAVQVATNGTMYVKGGMHMASEVVSGTVVSDAVVTQKGLTVLTGDFIHDASSNVFTTIYGASSNPVTGTVEFRGNTDQMVTTRLEAYTPAQTTPARLDQMDRSTQYLKFPNFKINNTKRVIITPSMGVSVNNLDFTSGRLRLKSDPIKDAEDYKAGVILGDQDASLLVEGSAIGYVDSIAGTVGSGNFMEIERNIVNNRGNITDWGDDPVRYVGFSTPLANMYFDYFTDHFVKDFRLVNEDSLQRRPWERFQPGLGYYIAVRNEPNTTTLNPKDFTRDGMYIQNKEFVFARTFYPDFFDEDGIDNHPWNYGWDPYKKENMGYEWQSGISMGGEKMPQEILSTGDVSIPNGLQYGYNYLGNPYTCALSTDALFRYWETEEGGKVNYDIDNGDFYPWIWVWSGQDGCRYLITKDDMNTLDMDNEEKVIPSQQLFVVLSKTRSSFTIPASARIHNPHRFLRRAEPLRNELLIEVRETGLDKRSRMAIGLRSWGKESGDDKSDVEIFEAEGKVNVKDATTPQIYARVPKTEGSSASIKLSINSLPEETVSTDLEFVPSKLNGTRKYEMKFRRWESLETDIVLLIDKKTGAQHNIREDGPYKFEAEFETGNNPDLYKRFTILFKNPNQIENSNICLRDAYFHGQTLHITNNKESDIGKSIQIYSTSGMLIYRNEINYAGTNTYELNLTEGVYIVKSGEMVKKIKK